MISPLETDDLTVKVDVLANVVGICVGVDVFVNVTVVGEVTSTIWEREVREAEVVLGHVSEKVKRVV